MLISRAYAISIYTFMFRPFTFYMCEVMKSCSSGRATFE